MHTFKLATLSRLAGLVLALGTANAALADQWDTLGSKHSRQVQRYDTFDGYGRHDRHGRNDRFDNRRYDDHAGRGHAYGHDRHDTRVNIIVAPRVPVSRWAPRWNDGYRRYPDYRDYRSDAFVVGAGVGLLAGTVIGLNVAPQVMAPQIVQRDYYVHEYSAPTTVIRHEVGRSTVSLFKDRFGACYERETDRYGQLIQRRVADYNCNF